MNAKDEVTQMLHAAATQACMLKDYTERVAALLADIDPDSEAEWDKLSLQVSKLSKQYFPQLTIDMGRFILDTNNRCATIPIVLNAKNATRE